MKARPDGPDTVAGAAGLVVRVDRGAAVLETDGGHQVRAGWGGPLLAAMATDPDGAPCTGDEVVWRAWPDGRATVEAVRPRRTLLARAEASGTSARQLLAANVDVVAVVEGLVPDPDLRRISRLVSLGWSSGAEPVVILTKGDLSAAGADVAAELEATAVCPVLRVSSVTGAGVDAVRALVAGGRVLALLGASGVGKSSLLNALRGDEVMRVNDLRADGKGRHTTVTRELHRVAGGAVIDCPGLRSVGLADADGLEFSFADVLRFAEDCRFRDCGHDGEPGCAVRAAVEEGVLPADRLDGWHELVAEGRRQELRRSSRLRAEQGRLIRSQARALRRARPHRP